MGRLGRHSGSAWVGSVGRLGRHSGSAWVGFVGLHSIFITFWFYIIYLDGQFFSRGGPPGGIFSPLFSPKSGGLHLKVKVNLKKMTFLVGKKKWSSIFWCRSF